MENALATIGDFGLVMHDWIFTEAHLAASLFLPIALGDKSVTDSFNNE